MKQQIKIEQGSSYKVGMDEIPGLEAAMREAFKPVVEHLQDLAYWNRETDAEKSEYKRRDGFIPHSHNCGGLEWSTVVPSCVKYEFDFLEFGECDECGKADEYPEGDHQCGYKGFECAYESEGHLDAKLRVWFKFEGLEDGTLKFYLYAGGGNGDAPYFRTKYETDLFEASFEAKSLAGIQRTASKHIKALLKVLGA